MKTGKIIQVIGPVIDAEFETGNLPELNNAVMVRTEDQEDKTREFNLTFEEACARDARRPVAAARLAPAERVLCQGVVGEPALLRPLIATTEWSQWRV